MAGLTTRSTFVGVKPEAVEGTYLQPVAADLIKVIDPPVYSPAVEVLERSEIKGSIGRSKPLHGMRSGTIEMNVELKSGGETAGVVDQPEIHELMLSAFGSVTSPGNATTDVGSTDTIIELTVGGGAPFAAGDILNIEGEIRFIKSIATDTITLNQALGKGAPSSAVTVTGGYTYKPTTTGHNPLSIGIWYGNDWEARGVGGRVSNFSLSDVATGQIGKAAFTIELLNYDNVAPSTAPSPAAFNPTDPPVWLNGSILKDATEFCTKTVELGMEQTVTAEECITEIGGKSRLFLTDRNISGVVSPQVDSSNLDIWTDFRDNVDFELMVAAAKFLANGDLVVGTGVGFYCPQTNFTGLGFEDSDGIMVHNLPTSMHESAATNDDLYFGFV